MTDTRWDRQVDQRDSYLAGLVARLDLPLAPIQQHLLTYDGEDVEPVELALRVLALLPMVGRLDAAAVLCGVVAGEWCAADVSARGLGRLGIREAASELMAAWGGTVHSLAREAFLDGLRGCAPHEAEAVVVEGLDDCESTVQQRACEAAPDNPAVRSRLRELTADPLAPEVHEAANTQLQVLAIRP